MSVSSPTIEKFEYVLFYIVLFERGSLRCRMVVRVGRFMLCGPRKNLRSVSSPKTERFEFLCCTLCFLRVGSGSKGLGSKGISDGRTDGRTDK